MSTRESVDVASVPFRVATCDSAADEVLGLARARVAQPVRLANAYSLASASKSPEYFRVISGAGSNYPDGAPVVWFMRLFSRSRCPGRVRGPSLFRRVLEKSRDTGLRHMFVGATEETLTRLIAAIDKEYPGVEVGGVYAPPFASVSDAFIEDIAQVAQYHDCDLVWIGLGTPKQDIVAALLAERVNAPCVGVGAAFDFVAGTVPEAPEFYQRFGLEWIYRFASEPRRLWRRYTIGNLHFLLAVSRSKLRRRLDVQ